MLIFVSLLTCGLLLIPLGRASAAAIARQGSNQHNTVVEAAHTSHSMILADASAVVRPVQGPNCNYRVAWPPQATTELVRFVPRDISEDQTTLSGSGQSTAVRHVVWRIRGSSHRHPLSTLLGLLMIGGASGRRN